MRRNGMIAACLALAIAGPAAAQQSGAGTFEDLGRKTDRFLEELLKEFGPAFRELGDQLRELDQYEAPEILPNGDIIIRRKRPRTAPDDRSPHRDERRKRGKVDDYEDTRI